MKVILSIDGLSYQDLDWNCMPTLKQIADENIYCKKMHVHFPSVTWHIHTSFFTGKSMHEHKVFGNTFLDESKNLHYYWNADVNKEETLHAQTFYDILKKQNKTIASVCLPLTQGAKNIDYNIPEFYSQEEFDNFSSTDFYKELQEQGFPMHRYGLWSNTPELGTLQDDLTQNIMEYLIKNKKPDVLLGHYLLIDTFEHYYGCNSAEKKFALRYVDGLIARLISCLKEENLWEDIELVIFSDHGLSDITMSWDIDKALEEAKLKEFVNYADDGGALHFYLSDLDKCNEFEQFLKSVEYINYFHKLEREENLSRKPDYQASFIEGCVTKEYALAHKNGATHGYKPDLCDRMNTFALCINKEKSSEIIEEMNITDLYSYIINNK